jgi:transposase
VRFAHRRRGHDQCSCRHTDSIGHSAIDFRKGAHGLAALAQEVLAEDPFSGTVIVYRSKRADRVKILVWDTSGLVPISSATFRSHHSDMLIETDKRTHVWDGHHHAA